MTEAHLGQDGSLASLRRAARSMGVDESALLEATDEPAVFGLMIEALLFPPGDGDALPFAEAARRAGLQEQAARRIWRALGNRDPADTERLSPGEVQMLSFFDAVQTLAGMDGASQLAWEVGATIGRLADQVVSELEFRVGYPRGRPGTPRLELVPFYENLVNDLLPALSNVMGTVLRQRLAGKVPYDWPAQDRGLPSSHQAVVAVGFDGRLPDRATEAIDALTAELETNARRCSGRLVRYVEDGALLAFHAPDDAVGAALAAVSSPRSASLGASAGLGWGPVSVRGGDLFGPVVNSAVRLARVTSAGEVFATADFESVTARADLFEPAPVTVFRGIDGHVGAYRLRRQ